jgi:hypothetical protein
MTLTKIDQEELDRIAKGLGPDVVYIRCSFGDDWAGDSAVYFRVLLADDVIGDRLSRIIRRVPDTLEHEFQLSELDLYSYIRYRGFSEQQAIDEPEWR